MAGPFRSLKEPVGTRCDLLSFYDFVGEVWDGAENPAPLRRICTLMRKMGASWLVREELGVDGELLEEKEDTIAALKTDLHTEALRLTFFRAVPECETDDQLLSQPDSVLNHAVLGYAIILTHRWSESNRTTHVLEAVLRTPTKWLDNESTGVCNYYVHCSRKFEVFVGNRALAVHGSFFSQQNGLTHVCAHSALRSSLLSSPLYAGAPVTNRKINEAAGFGDSPWLGKNGLTPEQMQSVAKTFGWNFHFADFGIRADVDCQAFIYPLIESGCPIVLGVERPDIAHTVAVLGHTLNTDRWMPEARRGYARKNTTRLESEYIPSTEWVDHLIVHDDNYGMYLTLPENDVRSILVPRHNPNLHASFALGLLPYNTTTAGHIAERVAVDRASKLLQNTTPDRSNRWFCRLQTDSKAGELVARTLFISKTAYVTALAYAAKEIDEFFWTEEQESIAQLPERFWVTELTVPNLYTGNKRKLGDVIVTPNQEIIFAWMPGMSWRGNSPVPFTWPFYSHIPLLRGVGGIGCRPVEW